MAKQKAQYQSSVLVEGRQQSFKQKFVRAMRRDWQSLSAVRSCIVVHICIQLWTNVRPADCI